MDEKKTYSIVGQVTIGTDEYRDLVEGKLAAEKELSEYRSKYWRKEEEVKKIQEKLDELQKNYDKLAEFVKMDNERYQCYVQYIAQVKL